jgi:hypothetical protein
MKKTIYFLVLCSLATSVSRAQQLAEKVPYNNGAAQVQPFLFSINTLTSDAPTWSLNYSGSYGERAAGAFGYSGLDQQVAVKGYLGNRFTLIANAAVGFARTGQVNSAQHVEIIRDFFGGKQALGSRLGLGFGVSRDWSNTKALFSRVTGFFESDSWQFGGNLLFEKAFNTKRDNIDLITSAGVHRRITRRIYAGIEAVGQDLEGFWDKSEAEGGAKLLIGPSINIRPAGNKFALSLSGGPVFYATKSSVLPSEAIRDIGSGPLNNGYTVRASATFNIR